MALIIGVSAGVGAAIGIGLSRLHCRITGEAHTKTLQNKYTGLCIFLAIFLANVLISNARRQ